MRRTLFIAALAASVLSGCGEAARQPSPDSADKQSPAPRFERGSLEWAAGGPWRIEPERDQWRHPVETLRFWGVEPDMTVVEIFPGRGWYSAILAPYLKQGGGKLIVASFDPATATKAQQETLAYYRAKFGADPALFGEIDETVLSPTSDGVAPPSSADVIIVARNIHTLLGAGYAEKAFADFYRALRPGGILAIEQHRAPTTGIQDPQGGTGYVQEAFVRLLAEEAGFAFVNSSEINANPQDDRDHPFGVWTLPPTLRTAPLGEPPNPAFDTSPYIAVGESDRMTLRFVKPK
jgi:predicted methyltransferase